MTDSPIQEGGKTFSSPWRIDEIIAKRRSLAETKFASATRDELLDHIARIEATLYTLTVPLDGLDVQPGPHCAASISSKLFPASCFECPDGEYPVWEGEKKTFVPMPVPDERLHEVDYAEEDSITIYDGAKLNDRFQILSVHQTATAASIFCGAIWMGDIRRAAKLLWG